MATWTATPDEYREKAGYVPNLADALLDLLGPADGLDILDLGCGEGTIAARLADQGASVVAVDADPGMVEATMERGIDARVADARTLASVDGPFDAVLSNAVLHWIPRSDQAEVAASVARVLRPGGRFVAEFGGHGNCAAVLVALRAALDGAGHPYVTVPQWYFPTPDEHAGVLEEAGFVVDDVALVPRPTAAPAGARAWLEAFAGSVLAEIEDDATRVLTDAERRLRPVLCDLAGNWTIDYVRLRVAAHLPDA